MHPHLLSVDDLSRDDIERILGRAESFAEVSGREIKKVPTLRGRTVINLFYEASTHTSSSFELAAKRLSADLVTVKAQGSAVDKGESLKDTVQTLTAYDPAAIVIRSPHAGAAGLLAGWTRAAVINAGDGKREHPTQALLDLFALRRRVGTRLDGLKIWIVGDILHSRVARSGILAFARMGCEVIDECLQIHGGAGYMKEYGIERAWRDMRLNRIGAGTDEIMLDVIGRSYGL